MIPPKDMKIPEDAVFPKEMKTKEGNPIIPKNIKIASKKPLGFEKRFAKEFKKEVKVEKKKKGWLDKLKG